MHYTIDSEFSRCLNTLYKSGNPNATRNEDFVWAILHELNYKLRKDGRSYDNRKVSDRINSLKFLRKSDSELWDRCYLGMSRERITLTDEDFASIFKDALPYLKAKL